MSNVGIPYLRDYGVLTSKRFREQRVSATTWCRIVPSPAPPPPCRRSWGDTSKGCTAGKTTRRIVKGKTHCSRETAVCEPHERPVPLPRRGEAKPNAPAEDRRLAFAGSTGERQQRRSGAIVDLETDEAWPRG